jgi:hypothetical protein
MSFETKSSPTKRKSFDSLIKDVDSPKKRRESQEEIGRLIYERHQGDVATYYVDPTSTRSRPFYNNIRRDVVGNQGGPLRNLGCLGVGSLANNPPSNVPVYNQEQNSNSNGGYPVEVLYQALKPGTDKKDLADTANKIAQVSCFLQ